MLIFLDVETTGVEEKDKVCSVAIIAMQNNEETSMYELVNEGKKIPPEASSIHHITNEMIKDKGTFLEGEVYAFLQKHNNINTSLVSHNSEFTLAQLQGVGFKNKCSLIDTAQVCKHLIKEVQNYSLQYLRYELKLYQNESTPVVAHNALGDVRVVKHLYEYLLDMTSRDTMYELSFERVLLEKFTFGKYAGRYIEEISNSDRAYLEWMLSVDLDADLRYSIDYYLQG